MTTTYKLPVISLHMTVKEPRGYKPTTIRMPQDLAEWLRPLMSSSEERFLAVHLNAKHQIIGVHEVSHGTLSASLVHPREVFKAAVIGQAHALIFAHGKVLAGVSSKLRNCPAITKAPGIEHGNPKNPACLQCGWCLPA